MDDHLERSTSGMVISQCEGLTMVDSGTLCKVEYLHTNRGVLSGKMLSYLIGVWKTDGKSW